MLLFHRRRGRRDATIDALDGLIPSRVRTPAGVTVTDDVALRHSAVWACLRLRADLISTFPCDVYRKVGGLRVEVPKPPVLVTPGGERVDYVEWMYSTQVDLDRAGNTFGVITEKNALGLPARIDLVPLAEASVRVRNGMLHKYRLCGTDYDPEQVWHERQWTLPGLHVGLSPIAYAAWSIGESLSIQEFATTWFTNGGVPRAHLRNTARTMSQPAAQTIKERFKTSVSSGDVFVTGSDWEYKPIQAEQTGMEWLEARKFGVGDVARFLSCPGDLIDAAVTTGNITYANVTQRNLQFLVMHLGPAIVRRENALTKLTTAPRFVKLNTDALLRMDPLARAQALEVRIRSRQLAPSEARTLEDLPPFTDAQMAEFDRLFPAPAQAPPSGGPTP